MGKAIQGQNSQKQRNEEESDNEYDQMQPPEPGAVSLGLLPEARTLGRCRLEGLAPGLNLLGEAICPFGAVLKAACHDGEGVWSELGRNGNLPSRCLRKDGEEILRGEMGDFIRKESGDIWTRIGTSTKKLHQSREGGNERGG